MCIIHNWKYIKGNFNKYYECSKCRSRKIIEGRGGYQPIDTNWVQARDMLNGE